MIIKNRLFLLFFTLCALPTLQANNLAERVALLEQTVLSQGQTIKALTEKLTNLLQQGASISNPFYQIRSLRDLGAWTCTNKITIAKGALVVLGICTLKRYFMPEKSTGDNEIIEQARNIPGVSVQINESERKNNSNIIGQTIDRIGDFGMCLAGGAYNLANRALHAVISR